MLTECRCSGNFKEDSEPFTKGNIVALTNEERIRLVELIGKIEWPIHRDLFNAWCQNFPTSGVELAVMSLENCIFLRYRDDEFFKGWHLPGTLFVQGDTEASALKRLVNREVGMNVTQPVFIDRNFVPKGKGRFENKRGQEVTLLYLCFADASSYRGDGRFFKLWNIPNNVLGHHKKMIDKIRTSMSGESVPKKVCFQS